MSVLKRARDVADQQASSRVLAMLRSQHLSITAAVLGEYLAGVDRRLSVVEFHERLEADLEELKTDPVFTDFFAIEREPISLCKTWVEKGMLARRQDPTDHLEYYELTSAGQSVLTFLENIQAPKSATTHSRLDLLSQKLAEMEQLTNPSKAARLKLLTERKRALEKEIALVKSGQVSVLERDRAVESLVFLTDIARMIPKDFARVREEIAQLSIDLRRDLIDPKVTQHETLAETFARLDVIYEGDEGKSFQAFYDLLNSSQLRATFEDAIDGLARRGYLKQLPREDQQLLLSYIDLLRGQARPVNEMMQQLSRNLRDFVRSRQFQEYRALTEQLREIQALGAQATEKGLRPYHDVPVDLSETHLHSETVGRMQLGEPIKSRILDKIEVRELEEVDLAALKEQVRQTEIDFEQLVADINEVVAAGPATIGQILQERPAQQGLASVVGLLVLGDRFGTAQQGSRRELVSWQGMQDQIERMAAINVVWFERQINDF